MMEPFKMRNATGLDGPPGAKELVLTRLPTRTHFRGSSGGLLGPVSLKGGA